MRRLNWSALSPAERRAALARPARRRDATVTETVRRILEEVAGEGEAAVARWAERLDGVRPCAPWKRPTPRRWRKRAPRSTPATSKRWSSRSTMCACTMPGSGRRRSW